MRVSRSGVLAGLSLLAWAEAAGAGAPPSMVRLKDPLAASHLARALTGARERLADEGCARLFDDFQDARGTALRAKLAASGKSGGAWLEQLYFYDGSPRSACRKSAVLAHTFVGSRVVFVCGPAFLEAARRDPRLAEATVIHEALHSLGLEENPPTSLEITRQVMRRCRR